MKVKAHNTWLANLSFWLSIVSLPPYCEEATMLGAANPRRNGRTHRGLCLAAAAGLCMLGAVLVGARAAVVLTATTNPTDGTYLVTGIPASASHGLLKLVFTNLTAGTDLSLCACTPR